MGVHPKGTVTVKLFNMSFTDRLWKCPFVCFLSRPHGKEGRHGELAVSKIARKFGWNMKSLFPTQSISPIGSVRQSGISFLAFLSNPNAPQRIPCVAKLDSRSLVVVVLILLIMPYSSEMKQKDLPEKRTEKISFKSWKISWPLFFQSFAMRTVLLLIL